MELTLILWRPVNGIIAFINEHKAIKPIGKTYLVILVRQKRNTYTFILVLFLLLIVGKILPDDECRDIMHYALA